jgi:cell division septation protein DedD
VREAHFSTNFDPHARWGHEFCEKPSPLRPKTRHDRQNTLPDASRHIQTSKFPRSELLLDVQDASRRSDGGPNPKNNFAKQHKAMRINRRNRSQHEIAGIETSTKSQPARNHSQHSQSETTTSTKSQPARIRNQHSQDETTAGTKSKPTRNHNHHEIADASWKRTNAMKLNCNGAQLRLLFEPYSDSTKLSSHEALFLQCPCMLCTGSH